MEKKLVQYLDHLITVTEPIVSKYFKKITDAPISIVMNCKDIVLKDYAPPKNKIFTVSFISTLHRRRLFPEIIDTIGKIPNIKFVLAAKKENMDLYYKVEQKTKNYDNIEFLGQIPFDEVIPRTLEASVVIDPIDPDSRTEKIGIASKILDAMSCGRPTICTKGTYSAEIVEDLKCGLAVDFSIDAFKDAIIKLRDDPALCEKLGRIGLNVSLTKYNWDIEKEKLLKVYKELFNEVDKN
jgi:glycosyltransferase involved in cell wall biosynthesis